MRSRAAILKDLVLLQGNIESLENELSKFSWDIDLPLYSINSEDFIFVLKRIINDEISFDALPNGKFKQVRAIQTVTTDSPHGEMYKNHDGSKISYNDPSGGPNHDSDVFLYSNDRTAPLNYSKIKEIASNFGYDHVMRDTPVRNDKSYNGYKNFTWEAELSWVGQTNSGDWVLLRSMKYGFTATDYKIKLYDPPNLNYSPSQFTKQHKSDINSIIK